MILWYRHEIERRGPSDLSDDAIAILEIDGYDAEVTPDGTRWRDAETGAVIDDTGRA